MLRITLASLGLVSLTSTVFAQGAPPEGDADALAAQPASMPAEPPPRPPPVPRGPRLRNGFSLSIGQQWGSGPSQGFSAQLYGGDWRIGAQLDEAIGVYLHTHLSLGNALFGGGSGYTGNFAGALVGEYTLPMRVFLGGGAGFGVLNEPTGPLVQLRAGYYPFAARSEGNSRRLNVALDARWYFAGELIGTVTHIAITLGYDRF